MRITELLEYLVGDFRLAAVEILERHGYPTARVEYLGAGEQSVCYGAGEVALLIHLGSEEADVRPINSYPLQQWMTVQAIRAGTKTAAIQAVGDHPRPYALMRHIHGRNASAHKEASEAQRADWFRKMGAEARKINSVRTKGFGEVVPSNQGGWRGTYATWEAYLDAFIGKYLFQGPLSQEERSVRDLFLAQGILSSVELEKIAAWLNAVKGWPAQSVLTHYDNRLANLMVDGPEVTLVDWGLAYAGIGLPQELIKITEAPPAGPEHSPMSAFLEGYGVAEKERAAAIERGTLLLVLDGLAMSYSWAAAEGPIHLSSIRGWLQSIKNICDSTPCWADFRRAA